MTIDENNSRHLIADTGKVLRRISDQTVFGQEVYLGKTWYIGGQRLAEPVQELPGHFEEVDGTEYFAQYEVSDGQEEDV